MKLEWSIKVGKPESHKVLFRYYQLESSIEVGKQVSGFIFTLVKNTCDLIYNLESNVKQNCFLINFLIYIQNSCFKWN